MALAVLRLMFLMRLTLRLIAARATYFLCFAKEREPAFAIYTAAFAFIEHAYCVGKPS